QLNTGRATEADTVVGQFAIQTAHATQLDVAADTGQLLAFATTGDVVEHRPQHAEHQHQDEQHTQHLLDDVPEPWLGVERNIGNHLTALGGERHVDYADTVTTAGIEADRVLNQTSEARQFICAPRRTGGFAVG